MSKGILVMRHKIATHTCLLPVHTLRPAPPAGRTCFWLLRYRPGLRPRSSRPIQGYDVVSFCLCAIVTTNRSHYRSRRKRM